MRYLPAFAKVNLTLEVLGERSDGYHDISTVMQTIALHDLVGLQRAESTSLDVDGLTVSAGTDNLVRRAHDALERLTGRTLPARMFLHKRIPIGAGLGGGSSDAAATLRGLDGLFGLNLSPEGLRDCAAALGQDVPYFLHGGTAWASGRGDVLQPLPDVPCAWILVVWPDVSVSTAAIYRAADSRGHSGGTRSGALAARLRTGKPVTPDGLHNALEDVTVGHEPEVARLKARLRDVADFHMTGTGGAFFAWFDRREEAEGVRGRLEGLSSSLCTTVPRVDR